MPSPFVTGQSGPDAIAWLAQLWDRVTAQLSANSTTSLAIGTGSKSLTVETDKQFATGQTVRVTNTADVAKWMQGTVVTYNAATGALVVLVDTVSGSGTLASWVVALSGGIGPAGTGGWSPVFSIVTDSARRVLRIADWTGSTGTKPAVGDYVGPTGLVSTAAAAVDIRGPEGDITPALTALYNDTVTAAGTASAAAATATTKAGEASASAVTASGGATTATTKAGEASTSAATASTAATTATTKAGEASTSAATASGGATTATTKAGEASTSAASAVAAKAAAETARDDAQAAAAAVKRVALFFTFDSATADADPGAGKWRLNHATPSSATQLYIDLLASNGGDVSAWIDSWDDSTNPTKGELTLVDATNAAVWVKMQVTGLTTVAGYRKVAITYLAHNGALVAGHDFSAQYVAYGNKGNDGAGTVASVSGTAPIAVGGPASDPVVSIVPATGSVPGSMSAADKTKLDGVATGATANSSDAALRARASHTGTQLASTISDFDAQVRTSRLDQMAAPTASVALNSQRITGLAAPTSGSDAVTKSYADGLVVGLWDDRGAYDASGNVFPSSGGSGTAGAILKGDIWTISVAGTLGGVAVQVGDTVRALLDTPGSTLANWAFGETNFLYVPLNKASNLSDLPNAATARTNLGLGNLDNTSDANKPVSTAQQTAISAAASTVPLNSQMGTTYTLVLADAGKRVDMSNAASNVLTVPPNSSVAFPLTTILFVSRGGAGATSVAAGVGVTINRDGGLNISAQYKMLALIKTDTDTWLAIGGSA